MVKFNQLKEIEKAVSQLSPSELEEFRLWFSEFDAQAWERQFEKDVSQGKLDHLAKKALKHLRSGECTDL